MIDSIRALLVTKLKLSLSKNSDSLEFGSNEEGTLLSEEGGARQHPRKRVLTLTSRIKLQKHKVLRGLSLSLLLAPFVVVLFGLRLNAAHAQGALNQPCAQFPDAEICAQQKADPTGSKVPTILTNIISFIVYLTGAFSVLMVVVGGFKYVTSQGDANQTKSAKETITYALLGLVISISAMFIVRYVISRL